MPDLAPPLRNFTEDFFGPAIEAGTMTQKQAEFLTSGPFLMPLYSIIRDVRVGELTQEEVESGFLFVIKGDKFRLDGSLENGKILVAAGEAIGDAMVIQGSIAGVEERGRGCGSQGVRRVGTLIGSPVLDFAAPVVTRSKWVWGNAQRYPRFLGETSRRRP
jgi:hypothetical protein